MSRKIEGEAFASIRSARPRFYCNSGSKMKNDYEIQIDKKGHKELKKIGEHDLYAEIQSYAEEVKIENILARAAAGDDSMLNMRQGFYADITEFPTSLAEAQNSILKLSQGFDKLPAEIREKFDNSKEKFVSLFGTEEWAEYMGFTTEKTETTEKVDYIPRENAKDQILTPEGN